MAKPQSPRSDDPAAAARLRAARRTALILGIVAVAIFVFSIAKTMLH